MCALLTLADEVWNMNHPRPNPNKPYNIVKWEAKDFYSYKIKDEWVLRPYRKTDSKLKRVIRNNYWKGRNGRSKR